MHDLACHKQLGCLQSKSNDKPDCFSTCQTTQCRRTTAHQHLQCSERYSDWTKACTSSQGQPGSLPGTTTIPCELHQLCPLTYNSWQGSLLGARGEGLDELLP